MSTSGSDLTGEAVYRSEIVLVLEVDIDQSDQLGKMSWRGIHFDLKEGHLEGHLALNVASPAASSAPSGRSIGSFIVLKTMFIHVYHRSK